MCEDCYHMVPPRHLKQHLTSMTSYFQGTIQMVVPDCIDEFIMLQDTIKKYFLPSLVWRKRI